MEKGFCKLRINLRMLLKFKGNQDQVVKQLGEKYEKRVVKRKMKEENPDLYKKEKERKKKKSEKKEILI